MRLIGARDRETLGDLFVHFVGEADAELQDVALHSTEVADALDLELLLVALGDADQHVVDQCAGQAVVSADFTLVRLAGAHDRAAIHFDVDLRPVLVFELAELALDSHSAIGDVYFDATRYCNRFFAYAGHG